jgi:hypothetical protein
VQERGAGNGGIRTHRCLGGYAASYDRARLQYRRTRVGPYVRIAVSDAGPGFGEDVAKRLFEPFFTTRPAGTGLGLATVRKIVRDHDGAVDVASAPGKGSRFEVWLPAAKTDAPTTARANPVAPPRLGQGETVLIVHDDRDSLLGDEEILAALGYEPIGFDRPADAIAAVRSEPTRFDAY